MRFIMYNVLIRQPAIRNRAMPQLEINMSSAAESVAVAEDGKLRPGAVSLLHHSSCSKTDAVRA